MDLVGRTSSVMRPVDHNHLSKRTVLEGGSDDFNEKIEDPHECDNWLADSFDITEVASESPWQISASQIDTSNTSSSTSERLAEKEKQITKSGKEEDFKYKCRFCGQIFPKSQALGGHMNRHRHEREREKIIKAHELLEQQERGRPNLLKNGGSEVHNFISTASSSVPPHMAGMQPQEQNNIYQKPTSSWNGGRPTYAPQYVNSICQLNMLYVNSEGRNQDTMPGMSYERNPTQQHILPSNTTNTNNSWPSVG